MKLTTESFWRAGCREADGADFETRSVGEGVRHDASAAAFLADASGYFSKPLKESAIGSHGTPLAFSSEGSVHRLVVPAVTVLLGRGESAKTLRFSRPSNLTAFAPDLGLG